MATIACLLSFLAAGISVLGWAAPALLNRFADFVTVIGFLLVFIGTGGTLIVVWANGVETLVRQGWRTASQGPSFDLSISRIPRRLKQMLAAIIVVAVTSAVFSVIRTAGYSQNPPGTLSRCQWSIGTNHGLTNLCVSHARWLSTGDEFQRIFIGFMAIFLALGCAAFAAAGPKEFAA
jgi:hypothetical protein